MADSSAGWLGKDVTALFTGPSGTGKSMAAEVIANELRLDLYSIDVAGIVSKCIGETGQNLERIFAVIESANPVLFFSTKPTRCSVDRGARLSR